MSGKVSITNGTLLNRETLLTARTMAAKRAIESYGVEKASFLLACNLQSLHDQLSAAFRREERLEAEITNLKLQVTQYQIREQSGQDLARLTAEELDRD